MMIDKLVYRTAYERELPVCAEFWHAMFVEIGKKNLSSWAQDWPARFVAYFSRRMRTGEATWYVCESDGEIVATACALVKDGYPHEINGLRWGYILGVRVDPDFRRRGIAERLTQQCIEWLKAESCDPIYLHASNAGRPIYERLGFVANNEMRLVD
jgi:GNAT superfamily N-acetyltransferase